MSSSSETLLNHIANFLKLISNTQSFWFSLDTRYGHGCHLANRFCLEPNDYEVLLIVADLAHYTRFGFAMKPMAWSKFLGGGGGKNITINHSCGGGGWRQRKQRRHSAGAVAAMSNDDDNDNDDNDDGYNNGGQQRWRRLPAPVPIDGAL